MILYLFSQHIFFFLLHHHHHHFFFCYYYYYCCVRSLPLQHGFFSKPSLSRPIKLVHSDQLLMQSSMVLTGLQDQQGNSTCTDLLICWSYISNLCMLCSPSGLRCWLFPRGSPRPCRGHSLAAGRLPWLSLVQRCFSGPPRPRSPLILRRATWTRAARLS